MLLLFQWNRLPSDIYTIPDYLIPRRRHTPSGRERLESPSQSLHFATTLFTYCSWWASQASDRTLKRERERSKPIKIATRVSARASVRLSMNQCASDLLFLYIILCIAFSAQWISKETNDEIQIIDSIQSNSVVLLSLRCFVLCLWFQEPRKSFASSIWYVRVRWNITERNQKTLGNAKRE